MPDIYGRQSLLDYEPYATYAAQTGVTLEEVQDEALSHAAMVGAPPHDFDALGSLAHQAHIGPRLGAAALAVDSDFDPIGFMQPNYASVSSLIIEELRRSHRFEGMVSMPANITVADRTRIIREMEGRGRAEYTDWAGTDSPTVSLGIATGSYPYWPITVDVPYENSELMAAARQGIPLDSELMKRAVKYCKDTAQRQMFFGGMAGERLGAAGKIGLFNQPITGDSAVIYKVLTASLESMAPDDIHEVFREQIARWSTETNQAFTTEINATAFLCLPPAQYQYIDSVKRTETDMYIRDWIETRNPWTRAEAGGPLMIKEMAELSNAGDGANVDRAVIHIMDETMSEFAWLEPMPGPPLVQHFTTTIRLRAVTGPFYPIRRHSIIYIDMPQA